MTNKEFNLSEKIEINHFSQYDEVIPKKDVAEFIREIDTLCSLLIDGQISMAEFQDRRKKLAGEKFK